MATRFYLSSTDVGDITPAIRGSWTRTADTAIRRMSISKDGSATTSATTWAGGSAATNATALCRQFVSNPLTPGQGFLNTHTFKCYIRCMESGLDDNINRQAIGIYIISRDGSVLRTTLKAQGHYGPNTTEWALSLTSKTFGDGDTLDTVYTTVSGDRLLVEIGNQVAAGGGATVTGTMSFGTVGGADLAENEIGSTANDPWFEMSINLTFGDEAVVTGQSITPALGSVTVTATASNTVAVAGQSITPALGVPSVVISAAVAPSGVSITPVLGSVTVITSVFGLDIVDNIAGTLQITPVLGTISVIAGGNASVTPSGLAITPVLGTIGVVGSVNVAVSGLAVVPTLGTIVVRGSVNVPITGLVITPTLGSVSVSAGSSVSFNPTGLAITPVLGVPVVVISFNATVTPTGLSITPILGIVSVRGDVGVSVSGLFITPQLGLVSVNAASNVVVTPSGLVITPTLGFVVVSTARVVSVTGLSITPTLGTIGVIGSVVAPVSGLSIVPTLGIVSVLVAIDTSVLVNGLSITPQLGVISTQNAVNMAVQGLQIKARLGANIHVFVVPTGYKNQIIDSQLEIENLPGQVVIPVGLSTVRRPGALTFEYTKAFTLGPVALGDASVGILDHAWYVEVRGTDVWTARSNAAYDGWDSETLLFSFTGAEILELDASFEQNGRIVVVAERPTGPAGASEIWLYWFDPIPLVGWQFVNLGSGRTPRTVLDNPQDTSTSDVHLAWMKDGTGLVTRRQSERYAIENLTNFPDSANWFVEEFARNRGGRLVVILSHKSGDRYYLDRVESTLYPFYDTDKLTIGASVLSTSTLYVSTIDANIDVEKVSIDAAVISVSTLRQILITALVDPEKVSVDAIVLPTSVLQQVLITGLVDPEKVSIDAAVRNTSTLVAVIIVGLIDPEKISLDASVLNTSTLAP